jgi:hypothetical protein
LNAHLVTDGRPIATEKLATSLAPIAVVGHVSVSERREARVICRGGDDE